MENKIPKPKEFTDAEAAAFLEYLTKTKKWKTIILPPETPQTLVKAFLETKIGKQLLREWIRNKKEKVKK